MLSAFLLLTLVTFVLKLLILRLVLAEIISARRLFERSTMSSAESRPSSRVVRVHCMPS